MNTPSPEILDYASEIIDRFGGIRPMASKIDVAVTTVQGWKKRGSIPPSRMQEIVNAADIYNVDLSGIIKHSAMNENHQKPQVQEIDQPKTEEKMAALDEQKTFAEPELETANNANGEALEESLIASILYDDIIEKVKQMEGRAVIKSTWITIGLISLTAVALGMLVWPAIAPSPDTDRAAELERFEKMSLEMEQMKTDMQSMKERQGFFGQIIPDNLDERLSAIKQDALDARNSASGAVNEARSIANEIANGRAEMLIQRIAELEKQFGQFANAPLLSSLLQRYEAFNATAGGQDLLDNSTSQLAEILKGINTKDEAQIQQAIDQARTDNVDLGQSFEGVPPQDLKAAAMLMAMTQLRSSLNRENEPFMNDLEVLKSLIGDENPALADSIDRLSPHAASGVLTPSGLSNELKSLTGDVVVASLKGEDVSFQERAKARINHFLQLEKEGELITGTQTQATLTKAQASLDQGNVSDAITLIKTLEGDAGSVLEPWLAQAEAALLAQEFEKTISTTLQSKSLGNASRYTTQGYRPN
jgi:hypothetical protein